MLGFVGRKLLNGYTENTPQYKATEGMDTAGKDFLKKKKLNKFMAVSLLINSDQERF